MSVSKINGYDAPYRSKTFQGIVSSLVGRSGLLAIAGPITADGSNVIVPPVTFAQAGLLVDVTATRLVPLPGLTGPYLLTVSSPTAANLDNLLWQFAVTPRDVTANQVVVGLWDGNEWRTAPLITVAGFYDNQAAAAIATGQVGPLYGLHTTYASGSYATTAGALFDKQGRLVTFAKPLVSAALAAESESGWSRVDRLVYRRAADNPARIGVRQQVRGGAYAGASPVAAHPQTLLSNAAPRQRTRAVVGTDNVLHVVCASGYGASFALTYRKLAADRTTVLVSAMVLATASSPDFSLAIDGANQLHVAYQTNSTAITWSTFNSGGVTATATLTNAADVCSRPKIVVSSAADRVFFVYERLIAASNRQIYFASLSLLGLVATAPRRLSSGGGDLATPSVAMSADLWLHVVWQDAVAATIQYQLFDDVGVALTTQVDVTATSSDGTTSVFGGGVTAGASLPKIAVADNRQVFICFLQGNGVNQRVAIAIDGARPVIYNLLAADNGYLDFSFTVEPAFNGLHFLISGSSAAYVRLDGATVGATLVLSASAATAPQLTLDPAGALFHVWSGTSPGTYSSYATGAVVSDIGPATVTGSSGSVILQPNQVLITSASAAPVVGDEATVAGAATAGNNGSKVITASVNVSISALNDHHLLTLDSAYAAAQSPASGVTADYSSPDGYATSGAMSTSETKTGAYRYAELGTDVLLARLPADRGPLNWLQGGPEAHDHQRVVACAGAVVADWGATAASAFTFTGTLTLVDLVHAVDYTVQNGTYPVADGQGLYVRLTGIAGVLTPLTAAIEELPLAEDVQILGISKGGQFVPMLLGSASFGELDPGEQVTLGQDLPVALRSKLGFISETAIVPYSSTIGFNQTDDYPTAISQTNLMAGQNRHIRLVRARVSWGLTANTLTLATDGYLQVPGLLETRNRIAAGAVVLTTDGQVAYVNINRTGSTAAALAVQVAAVSALVMGRDTVILARRIGADLVLEQDGIKLAAGYSVDLEAVSAKSIQPDATAFAGSLSTADTDLQLALATLDVYFKALQLTPHPTLRTRVVLSGADQLKTTGTTLGQLVKKQLVSFTGAQIDLATGNIYAADGTTVLSTFTPATVAASQFRWYAIGLSVSSLGSDNRWTVGLAVNPALADGGGFLVAKRADFRGDVPVGQVYVQKKFDNSTIEDIAAVNITQLGVGSGGGGGSGGDVSFVPSNLASGVLTLQGGELSFGNGTTYVTGSGPSSLGVGAGIDINVVLSTILPVPAATTTYYLAIDTFAAGAETALSDNSRLVVPVSTASQFALLTGDPLLFPSFRYIPVAWLRTVGASWTAATAGPTATRFFGQTAIALPESNKFVITAAGTTTFGHQLTGEPDIVDVRYFDGTSRAGESAAATIEDAGATTMRVNTGSYVLTGTQQLVVRVFRFNTSANAVVSPLTQFKSPWYQDSSAATIPHGLKDMDQIVNFSVQTWDLSLGVRKKISDSFVTKWDDTYLYPDWRGAAPSATLRYRVVAGASVLQAAGTSPNAPTKVVGFGPGAYATMAAALAAAASGDSIWVNRDTAETADLSVPAGVSVNQAPGTTVVFTGAAIVNGVRLVGPKAKWANMDVRFDVTAGATKGLSVEAGDCWASGWLEWNSASVLAAAVNVASGGVRVYAQVGVKRSLGTVTTLLTNNDGAGKVDVWGG